MQPQKSQFVKIVFRNGSLLEGTVLEWSDAESILLSSDEKSTLVILQTKQDILFFKIVADYLSPKELPKKTLELEQAFQEEYEKPSADELRVKKLAQLKIMMNEQEKVIISHKLREHFPYK